MKIVLIGMMGCGKSTVGRLLAREIGFPFVDSDHLIEAQTGKTVAQIFAEEGEAAFRRLENRVVEELATLDRVVLACGGGTLNDRFNREKLRSNSLWIYLKASPETLWRRLSNSPQPLDKRPLLSGDDPKGRIAALLAEREPIYQQADLIVPTGEQPVHQIVERIADLLPESILRHPEEEEGDDEVAPPSMTTAKTPEDTGADRVDVRLGERSYPIWIGRGLLQTAGEYVSRLLPPPSRGYRRAVVIGQPVPLRHYSPPLLESLRQAGYVVHASEIADGEPAKSLESAAALYDRLVDFGADRSTVLLSLGGGVAGDLVGYVAATFMRGLPFVQVPTTLLAQVDASIGGKVAVNHPKGKNLIGAFYQPRAVLIDTDTLHSLPGEEFRNGMAEVIKYALLAGEGDVEQLERHREAILQRNEVALRRMIVRCCRAKAKVVEEDETDRGLRMILNLGHTFAHAFESLSAYESLKHGEAVSIGCCLAAELSRRLGMLDAASADRIVRLMASYGLPTRMPDLDPRAVYERFFHDKKAVGGRLRFVLLRKIGEVVIRDDVPADMVLKLLEDRGGAS